MPAKGLVLKRKDGFSLRYGHKKLIDSFPGLVLCLLRKRKVSSIGLRLPANAVFKFFNVHCMVFLLLFTKLFSG